VSNDKHIAPRHVELLGRSAVPAAYAESLGCYTAETSSDLPDELRQYAGAVPGLVFPLRDVEGKVHWQLRPDAPGGPKAPKYLQASGTGSIITVHPTMSGRVGNVKRAVFVEGTKQTLAATYHAPDDTLVVGLQGCQNWRADNVPHPDIARLGLDKAEVVVIVFDADYRTNEDVWAAARGLAEHLEALGAPQVRFAHVPGAKTTGLDDYLGLSFHGEAQRRKVFAGLLDGATDKLGRKPASKAGKAKAGATKLVCDMERGLTVRLSDDDDKEVVVMRAAGRIVRDVAMLDEDSGANLPSLLDVEVALPAPDDYDEDDVDDDEAGGRTGGPRIVSRIVTVQNDKLRDIDALLDATHMATHVDRPTSPGMQVEVANAIRRCRSDETERQTAYPRLGWTFYEPEGVWVFLHNGGAIGPDCSFQEIRSRMSGRGGYIDFGDPYAYNERKVKAGIKASIDNLRLLADPTPWWALLGAIGLAPTGLLPKSSVSLLGEKSAGKSGLLQTATSFLSERFGYSGSPMTTADDTSNYIDLALVGHNDSFVLIDDFHPEYDPREQSRQAKTVDLVLRRSHGSPSKGRARVSNSQVVPATVNESHPLTLMSFEQLPDVVDSGLDRTLVIPVTRESTFLPGCFDDFVRPGDDGTFRVAYGSYIAFLARNMKYGPGGDSTEGLLIAAHMEKWPSGRGGRKLILEYLNYMREHDDQFSYLGGLKKAAPNATPRALRVAAGLLIGLGLWLGYAHRFGVISEDELKELFQEGHKAIGVALQRHTISTMGDNQSPAQRVLEIVRSAVASGKVTLGAPRGTIPRIGKVTEVEHGGQRVNVVAIDTHASIPGVGKEWVEALKPLSLPEPTSNRPTRPFKIGQAQVRCLVIPQEQAGIYEQEVEGDL
jgi:hypothetical protein